MTAYLLVDVDSMLDFSANNGIDLHEMAVALRGNAALVAGLFDTSKLKAVAIADWLAHRSGDWALSPRSIFEAAGYEHFDAADRSDLLERLQERYFAGVSAPLNELILATTCPDLLPLLNAVPLSRMSRLRVWSVDEGMLQGSPYEGLAIVQRLDSLYGIKTKNVWVYIDFENISISLNEQGYVVDLDHLIERLVTQAQAHGKLVKMAAYAPWGQRGALPPLVDAAGREVAGEAPSRLMMANIDPVFHLPGKQSADIRIARDVLTHAGYPESGDVIILATGDRDFNDVINPLLQRNKSVIVWGVRGSTGRLLQSHPSLQLEYIDDFTDFQTHQSLGDVATEEDTQCFIPSQWSSVIIQYFNMSNKEPSRAVSWTLLLRQLLQVDAVVSEERGNELLAQSISLGILRKQDDSEILTLNERHPIVEKTLLVTNRLLRRVANTLSTRNWEYVNYGFLLKGLEMERDLDRPGMNDSDQWRSHWIDCLVREGILQRDLVPHRHNPDDMVPVIRVSDSTPRPIVQQVEVDKVNMEEKIKSWDGLPPHQLAQDCRDVTHMVTRIVVSVQQFTSFRNFAWCPLGSLHRRLRAFDNGAVFQFAVEYLLINNMATVDEYENPRSEYKTKGIGLDENNPYVAALLAERDEFVRVLIGMYRSNIAISRESVQQQLNDSWDVELWLSIMTIENVLNPLPGRSDQLNLFRTHHTVKMVAQDDELELTAQGV